MFNRILFLLFCLIQLSEANDLNNNIPTTIIKDPEQVFDTFQIEMYQDPSSHLGIEDVIGRSFESNSNKISEGYSKSALWVRFRVTNATLDKLERSLFITVPYFDQVTCYILQKNAHPIVYQGGLDAFNNSNGKVERPNFPLQLNSKESKTIYLRIKSVAPLYGAVYLTSHSQIEEYIESVHIFYAMYFGIGIGLILYNISILLYTRNIAYFYYICYVGSFLLLMSSFVAMYPYDRIDASMEYHYAYFFIGSFLTFLTLFARALLNTAKELPIMDRLLKGIIVVLVLFSLIDLVFPKIGVHFLNILALITTFVLIFIGISSALRGNKIAIYFLTAQFVFLSASFLFSFSSLGFLRYDTIYQDIMVAGSAIEMILFSTALAYQLKLLNEQNKIQFMMMLHQQRLAQLGEMISMIAHQWRQPLSAINAIVIDKQIALAQIENDMSDKIDFKNYLFSTSESYKEIMRIVAHMSSTIDDFRNFYKPEKTASLLTVDKPIIKAVDLVAKQLKNLNIVLIKQFDSKSNLLLYESEFTQVILNLIKNAQDNFLDNPSMNMQISLITYEDEDHVIIEVSDNGGGIPDKFLNTIFDPYFSTKLNKQGSGLGLYMSKIIIEEHHNGSLEVINKDNGASFIIKLNKKTLQV